LAHVGIGPVATGPMRLLASLRARVIAPLHRRRFPIYVDAPPYNPQSGGSRAMNLLAQQLTRSGYDAYVLTHPSPGTRICPGVRYIDQATLEDHERSGRVPIVVYPEVVTGNPRNAPFVVRFLLNQPGYLVPGADRTYGADDFYLCFDMSYAPAGRSAFDLFMPLVDRSVYFPNSSHRNRQGFAIFAHRKVIDPTELPDWVSPYVVASMQAPRSPGELAGLYRSSRAMVTWERTSAIYEALCCGCPVICIAGGPFCEATYQRRFGGAGLVWGWDKDRLAQAAMEVAVFERLYADLERSLDVRIRTAFDAIIKCVLRRTDDGI
jgi:O-antigen biosynthesis protein